MLVHNTIGRGTFDRAHSIGRHLVKRGHNVTLFAGASARAAARCHLMDGVEVIEGFDPFSARGRESGLSPFELFHRFRGLRSRRWDLIHCFDHRPAVSLPGLIFARSRGTPCIFDWADLWGKEGIAGERPFLARMGLGTFDDVMENEVRRRADGLTVISTALRARAQQRFRAPAHLLQVGANSDLIRPLSKKETRQRLGLPLDVSIAVHTGLAPYDMPYLGQAFVELARRNPKAFLVMSGRRFPDLENIVESAGFSKRYVHLGLLDRSSLTAAMACADVLLIPFTNRSVNRFRHPNKFGDYISAGRPIVTNRTGDLGHIIAEEKIGLTVDDTPEAFAEAVNQLFEDPDLADQMGRRGREVAETKLDWSFLTADLDRFYSDILARR